jgi:hypothetical protein
MCRGENVTLKVCVCVCVCLCVCPQKKNADVTATSVLSFGVFLFRFPCLFAYGYQETMW